MEVKEVCKFYLEGKCRFKDRCRNLHPPGRGTETNSVVEKEHQIEETHHTDKQNELAVGKPDQGDGKSKSHGKKPPMKTATDVISRILWDTSLPAEHFVIGYLDRFLGILEQPFSIFDWSDLSSVDDNVLAIPKHRIQYFKYKDEKVWDKSIRLDIVFGSTGSSTSIEELMDSVDKRLTGDTPPEAVGQT